MTLFTLPTPTFPAPAFSTPAFPTPALPTSAFNVAQISPVSVALPPTSGDSA